MRAGTLVLCFVVAAVAADPRTARSQGAPSNPVLFVTQMPGVGSAP
jgi:hypothetical protein